MNLREHLTTKKSKSAKGFLALAPCNCGKRSCPECNPDPEPTVPCNRCGRPLRDHVRQADGMGVHCRRKKPHHRKLRRQLTESDGTVVFKLHSLTNKSELADEYVVKVNFEDGTFSCTCPDFQFRQKGCKHIQRACEWERRQRAASVRVYEHSCPVCLGDGCESCGETGRIREVI